jgi:hypothetical protein
MVVSCGVRGETKDLLFPITFFYGYIHTYHSRFIPEGVAEVSQIFLRDIHVLPKLADVTGGEPIAILLLWW